MMNDLNLYQCSEETTFENTLRQLVDTLFGRNIMAVMIKDCFIVAKPIDESKRIVVACSKGEIVLGESEYRLTQDSYLSNRGLAVGRQINEYKDVTSDIYSKKIVAFKEGLLKCERTWIDNYGKHLKVYLSSRMAEGVPIIQHDAVRMTWADLVERQQSLNQLIINIENISSGKSHNELFVFVPQLIREACELLAKIAGGRAFLEGQAVEMLWLFNIVNKIYFSGGYCNE